MAMLPGPYYQGYRGKIWPSVVGFLVLIFLGGLSIVGYPPARFLFHLMGRATLILGWAFFILFLYLVFRPQSK
jgi:hypothetical protein